MPTTRHIGYTDRHGPWQRSMIPGFICRYLRRYHWTGVATDDGYTEQWERRWVGVHVWRTWHTRAEHPAYGRRRTDYERGTVLGHPAFIAFTITVTLLYLSYTYGGI